MKRKHNYNMTRNRLVSKSEDYTETTGQTSNSQSIIGDTATYKAPRKRKRRRAKKKKLAIDDILQKNQSVEGLQQLDTNMANYPTKKLTIGSMEILIDYVNQNGVQIMRTRVAKSGKKLLILDVNGLLADIIDPPPKDCKSDKNIKRRAIFKRPFLDDFLRFCFERFDVAIWSSRTRKILNPVVDYLLGDLKKKLLFVWDLSHCTNSSARSLENRHKFIVFKEVKKIWEKNEYYDESNTLLLDDSPYKALLNPKHSGIFPLSYSYKDINDNSLGPDGDLRVYLEGVGTTENVNIYVKQNPFGQSAIDEKSPHWAFYAEVLKDVFQCNLK